MRPAKSEAHLPRKILKAFCGDGGLRSNFSNSIALLDLRDQAQAKKQLGMSRSPFESLDGRRPATPCRCAELNPNQPRSAHAAAGRKRPGPKNRSVGASPGPPPLVLSVARDLHLPLPSPNSACRCAAGADAESRRRGHVSTLPIFQDSLLLMAVRYRPVPRGVRLRHQARSEASRWRREDALVPGSPESPT